MNQAHEMPSHLPVDMNLLSLSGWQFKIPDGATVYGVSWPSDGQPPAAYVERGCGECSLIEGVRIDSDA